MEKTLFTSNNMEEMKPIFTTASDNQAATTTDSFSSSENKTVTNERKSVFSPLAAPFQSRMTSRELLSLVTPQEPRAADPAPSYSDIDEMLLNIRINGSESLFEGSSEQNSQSYFMESNRAESVRSSHGNIWSDNSSNLRSANHVDNFDFFVKSLSSANNYVSMLSREQMNVLKSFRPGLLYEFLLEVMRIRNDKRLRRALPNECAFCKNNGENEDVFSSHALKDWRGRVECPVLRAFRCPRCGATGDRAHTIKYCNNDRSGSFMRRRMSSPGSYVIGEEARMASYSAPSTPVISTSPPNLINSSFWSNFNMN